MLRVLTQATPAYAADLRRLLRQVRADIRRAKEKGQATALSQARAQEIGLVTELHRVLAELGPPPAPPLSQEQLFEVLVANLHRLPDLLAEHLHDALSDRLGIARHPRGPHA